MKFELSALSHESRVKFYLRTVFSAAGAALFMTFAPKPLSLRRPRLTFYGDYSSALVMKCLESPEHLPNGARPQ